MFGIARQAQREHQNICLWKYVGMHACMNATYIEPYTNTQSGLHAHDSTAIVILYKQLAPQAPRYFHLEICRQARRHPAGLHTSLGDRTSAARTRRRCRPLAQGYGSSRPRWPNGPEMSKLRLWHSGVVAEPHVYAGYLAICTGSRWQEMAALFWSALQHAPVCELVVPSLYLPFCPSIDLLNMMMPCYLT